MVTALASRGPSGVRVYSTKTLPPPSKCQIPRCHVEKKMAADAVTASNANRAALKLLGRRCSACESLRNLRVWNTDGCVLSSALETHTSRALFDKKAVVGETVIFGQLGGLNSEKGKVTSAGEGGAISGKPEYWDKLLHEVPKSTPIQLISIGGGPGHDASGIQDALQKLGFTEVLHPIVVDPDGTAALVADDTVRHYVLSSREFFDKYCEKVQTESPRETVFIMHIGTTFGVIPIDDSKQILSDLRARLHPRDKVSFIMIDADYLKKQHSITEGEVDGITGFQSFYKGGQLYKIAMRDPEKFKSYLSSLGFEVTYSKVESTGKEGIVVHFQIVKGSLNNVD